MKDARFSDAAVNRKANEMLSLLNGGFLCVYSGPQPESPDADPTAENILLAVLEFSQQAFKPAIGGLAIANPIAPDTSTRGSGMPTWFRTYALTREAIFDGTVGPEGSDEDYDLIMSGGVIEADNEVRVGTLYYTERKHA